MDDEPKKDVVKNPTPDPDVCLLCQRAIEPTERVIRTHGLLVHRTCYERDRYA